MNLGPAEILVIMVVALLVFGPARLPEMGRQVGAAMRELRRMQANLRRELDDALDEAPADTAPGPRSTTPRAAIEEPDHADVPPAPPVPSPPGLPPEPGPDEVPAGGDEAPASRDEAVAGSDEPRERA